MRSLRHVILYIFFLIPTICVIAPSLCSDARAQTKKVNTQTFKSNRANENYEAINMFYLITEKLASAHNYFVEGQQLTHLSYITTDGQTYVLRSDISGKIFRSLIEYKDISLKLSHWNVKSPLLNDFKSHLLSSIANQLKAIHIYIYTLTAYQKTGTSINSDMEKVHEYAVTSCTQLVDSITIFMAYIDYMDPDNHMLKHYVTNLYNSFQKAGPNM